MPRATSIPKSKKALPYLIPDLIAPEEPNIGVWGRRRKEFLRMNRNPIYLSFRKVLSTAREMKTDGKIIYLLPQKNGKSSKSSQ